jgi:uncharacterized protein (TIGR04255 family)
VPRPIHERLGSPPLIEAVFEIRAETGRPFSFLPGAMAGELAGTYPGLKETELNKIIGMLEIPPTMGFAATHVLSSSSGLRTVMLGPTGLAVSVKDYKDSHDFEDAIKPALTSYFDKGPVTRVLRLGLRYVNGIKEADPLIATIKWPALGETETVFTNLRSHFRYERPEGTLNVVVAYPDEIGIRLDLDFWLEPKRTMAVDDVIAWFDEGHERVHDAFTAMVKEDVYLKWKERVPVNG